MRALSYARKSDDSDAGISRQLDLCHDFATSKGWSLGGDFADNDVSGAVFQRKGLTDLLAALQSGDVLVCADASRLGRDMAEVLPLELRIIKAGVRVFFYEGGAELLLDTPTQKLVASVSNFAAEDYRYQVGVKTRDALNWKAAHGYATGRPCYGYRHEPENGHVVRIKVQAEVEIVERIFKMIADGRGLKATAIELNSAGIKGPEGLWRATGVRAVLFRDLYRGQATFRREHNVKVDGQRTRRIATPDRIISTTCERDRVISDQLWAKAHARLAATVATLESYRGPNGVLRGRPASHVGARLLSGYLACGSCGASMRLITISRYKTVTRSWACSRHRLGAGKPECRTMAQDTALERAVRSALDPAAIQAEVIRYLSTIELPNVEEERAELARELAEVEQKVSNVLHAIEAGGSMKPLTDRLRDLTGTRDRLAAELAREADAPLSPADFTALEFQDDPVADRAVLARVLVGRLLVTPVMEDGRAAGWSLQGLGTVARMVTRENCTGTGRR